MPGRKTQNVSTHNETPEQGHIQARRKEIGRERREAGDRGRREREKEMEMEMEKGKGRWWQAGQARVQAKMPVPVLPCLVLNVLFVLFVLLAFSFLSSSFSCHYHHT